MSENDSLHLQLLKKLLASQLELQETVAELDKKMELHAQKADYEFSQLKRLDEEQNALIDEHIAGVTTLRQMHKLLKDDIHARLERLETPRKALNYATSLILWLGSIAGATLGLIKLLQAIGS